MLEKSRSKSTFHIRDTSSTKWSTRARK